MLNPEKIRHQCLVHLPILPVYCSHFTLANLKKSFFSSIHTYFRLFTLSQKKKTATVVLQLICLLTASYYPHSRILWSVFISLVSNFQSYQCQPTTGSFQSHQHLEEQYAALPSVRCKSFAFYKVVR